MSLLLALTIVPAAGIQSAFADEPADRPVTTGGDVPLEGPAENTGLPAEEEADGPVTATVREDGSLVAEGLIYKSENNGAVLVGFEDGNALDREVIVPEKLTDGALEYTVKSVSVADGQSAPNVLSLELPQTVEDVDTKSLAAAMPALARVSVDGRGGEYSSANGMLFRQEAITASSDGSTTRIANRELVWAPPAMVIARIPGTCKTVAPGAFTDDRALETVMVFSIVDSVAKAEKDEGGNTTKEGAFTDEQVSRVNIVTPMETVVSSEGERISADAFLAEDAPLNEKHTPWCDCGFSMDRFTVGIPYGSTSLAVAVPEDGKAGTPEITIGKYTDHPEWDPKGDTGEPANGLVFEYKADMTVSVAWKGDKAAVPSHLELPAYVIENGVKTAVTEVAPSAFEGATQLESVVVPEGITIIGESAFAGCANLADADVPSTAKTLGTDAYEGTGIGASLLSSDASGDGASGDSSVSLGSAESPESASDAFEESDREEMSSGEDPVVSFYGESLSSYSSGPVVAGKTYTLYFFTSNTKYQAPIMPQQPAASAGITFTRLSSYYANITFIENAILTISWDYSGGIYFRNYTDTGGKFSYHLDLQLANDEYRVTGANVVGETILIYFSQTKDLSIPWNGVLNKPSSFPPEAHSHDERYYTEEEVNGLLGKTYTASDTVKSAIDAAKKAGTDAQETADEAKTAADAAQATADKKANSSDVYAKSVIGDGYTTENTVKNAIDAKADTDTVNSKNTEQDNKIKALEDAVGTSSSGDGALASRVSAAEGEIDALQSSFGTIAYDAASMEGVTSKAVMPTVYKAGGAPAIPEPEKDGCEFLGWTWKDGMQPAVGDAVREAFQASGATAPTVTLKAHWREVVPEASYFFSEERPFDSGNDASQSYTIAVRLTDQQNKTLQSVSFSKNDGGLLTGAADGVQFHVGADRGMAGGTYQTVGWDDAAQNVPMAALDGGGYGVYVRIVLPAGAVDQSKVVSSYTGGSYVASLVKLNYTFA